MAPAAKIPDPNLKRIGPDSVGEFEQLAGAPDLPAETSLSAVFGPGRQTLIDRLTCEQQRISAIGFDDMDALVARSSRVEREPPAIGGVPVAGPSKPVTWRCSVPSRLEIRISPLPVRRETKAILTPSGENCGLWSSRVELIAARLCPPGI